MTLSQLISSCPATVSDAAGVLNAINWFALVETFALSKTVETLPSKHLIISNSDIAFLDTKTGTTDYDAINDNLNHIKGLLTAANTI